MTHGEAVTALKAFVAGDYNGDVEANFRLDELLWAVRLSHPHNHPLTRMTEPAEPANIEIDLDDLGL